MALQKYTFPQYYEDGLGPNNHYQLTSLDNVITQFIIAYVGEDKIIPKAKRTDVAFHAQRALAELSFDTFKSCKAHEFEVPGSLSIPLPMDYVNYTKVSRVDSSGIKRILYPENKSSNPVFRPRQNNDGDYIFNVVATLTDGSNTFVLDGDYSKDLVHGMAFALHQYIAPQSYIHSITTTGGITSVGIFNKAGNNPKPATIDGSGVTSVSVELKLKRFSQTFGESRQPKNNTLVETTLSSGITAGDSIISVADVTGIEKGMLINHSAFTNTLNTSDSAAKVIGVGTNEIEISKPAVYAGTNGSAVSFLGKAKGSDTWENYKSNAPSENNNDNYEDDIYWPLAGNRYGLDPERAQSNGYFYIDCTTAKIHFSSNLSGKTVILDYISDRLGSAGEMQVHKFAEEAIYKWIAYGILSTRTNIPEYIVQRFKKEKFAETRKAKLRLSNIKLEEITQILRGKSKQIKH